MTAVQPDLVLFTGDFCELCERAREVIFSVIPPGLTLKEININSEQRWRDKYALTIPVIAIVDADRTVLFEKSWPFSAGQVRRIVENWKP